MDPAEKVLHDALVYVKPIEEATAPGNSEIQKFYKNSTLFFTGGTGFIGKQLIEKLFRSCDVKKAFVLIRPKKGKSTKERLQVMLSDEVFETVKKKKPDFVSRIVDVAGDISELGLGISVEDRKLITDEVNVIFHVAATVRFEEAIRDATLINVRGTREALALGKACRNLRAFVHVSTAYCHATTFRAGHEVNEEFYDSPMPPDTILKLVETVDNNRLDTITPSLITGWPNTYTFTKAIAEELVRSEAENLPVCVVRPSIVLSTYREPVPGWLDLSCIFGPSGIVFGVGIGALRVLFVNNKSKLSFVPVDFVNNATIAAGWETAVKHTKEPKIYHISTTNCGVTFRNVSVPMRGPKIRVLVSPKTIWYCFLIETYSRPVYFVLSWLLHYIPAYIADGAIAALQLKKPPEIKSFVEIYSKFDKMSSIFQFFLTNEWNFNDQNLDSLRKKMSETDRKIYDFDMKSIDWAHNTCMWTMGIRKYIIKDGMTGTEAAVAKQKWFKLGSYVIVAIYAFLFWKIFSWFWYFVSSMFF